MKKYIFCLIVIFCKYTMSYSQVLYAKEKGGKYGYVDSRKVVKIPFQYLFVYTDTLRSIAFVQSKDKIKAIDKNNRMLFTVFN